MILLYRPESNVTTVTSELTSVQLFSIPFFSAVLLVVLCTSLHSVERKHGCCNKSVFQRSTLIQFSSICFYLDEIVKMTTDERNFRSQYYEKVGFRSVEEKKSLEILLKERPLDKTKLKQFCLRFTVPAMYRNFLWKVLLDVVPVYTESQAFIMAQRKAEFQDLQRALRVAKIIDDFTKPHLMFLVMWLLRKRKAKVDMTTQLESPLYRAMSKMAETLWHIIDVELEEEKLVDVYWILSGLFVQVEKLQKEIGKLQDCTYMLLEKEDLELYKHLIKIDALYNLPYDAWFYSCFAGIICNGSIAKIWDKITVGAYRILIFVAVVTLTTLRRLLLRCESTETVLDTINNITEETSEVIVNKAIESMQQSGTTQQVDMYFTKHS